MGGEVEQTRDRARPSGQEVYIQPLKRNPTFKFMKRLR